MQAGYGKVIARNLLSGLGSPLTALKLVWRRLFPFGIVPKDPEAYRIGSWSYGRAARVPIADIFPGIEHVEVRLLNMYARDITTSVDPAEITALCAIIRSRGCRDILEIGTFDGNTTLNMAVNAGDDGRVTTIDLPPDWNGVYEIRVPGLYVNVTDRSTVGIQYRSHPWAVQHITQVYGDSAGLDWSTLPGPFDLVFIDGNHHYEYVKRDTENALRHLRPGGIVAWHDYGMIEDVSRAVDEYAGRVNVRVIRGTRLAIGVTGASTGR